MAVKPQAAARLLAARARRTREEREGTAAATRARLGQALLPQLPAGARAWLIGSLAWGGFGERSDIDLVLAGVCPASAAAIERSLTLALKVTVEVLRLEELPGAFQRRILSDGVVLDGR